MAFVQLGLGDDAWGLSGQEGEKVKRLGREMNRLTGPREQSHLRVEGEQVGALLDDPADGGNRLAAQGDGVRVTRIDHEERLHRRWHIVVLDIAACTHASNKQNDHSELFHSASG